MNCIFCKRNSDNSKSIEHIVPESLGNVEHTLPKGTVCDLCNNYFATKIEKEVLEQPYFKSIRSRNKILNKRGNVIAETGIIVHPDGGKVNVYYNDEGCVIDILESSIVNLIATGQTNKLYIPIYSEPEKNNLPLSRLLGKIALEALAQRLMKVPGWEEEVIYKKELDPLRNFVRYGPAKVKFWQYSQRRIYSELDSFVDLDSKKAPYEIIHEYMFHFSEKNELFFIVCIMGIEYAINLAGPEIETYLSIIAKAGGKSFLVDKKQQKINGNGFLY